MRTKLAKSAIEDEQSCLKSRHGSAKNLQDNNLSPRVDETDEMIAYKELDSMGDIDILSTQNAATFSDNYPKRSNSHSKHISQRQPMLNVARADTLNI
jgi:hypothetical protein